MCGTEALEVVIRAARDPCVGTSRERSKLVPIQRWGYVSDEEKATRQRFYNSSAWKKTREAVKHRDGKRCRFCDATDRSRQDSPCRLRPWNQDREVTSQVPLTGAALAALEEVPPRIDSRYVFTTTRICPGRNEPGPFDVANFRRRSWGPAID